MCFERDRQYPLGPDSITAFRRDGLVRCKQAFGSAVLEHFGEAITRLTLALNAEKPLVAGRPTHGKAFVQLTNLREHGGAARAFVFGKRMARIAAERSAAPPFVPAVHGSAKIKGGAGRSGRHPLVVAKPASAISQLCGSPPCPTGLQIPAWPCRGGLLSARPPGSMRRCRQRPRRPCPWRNAAGTCSHRRQACRT